MEIKQSRNSNRIRYVFGEDELQYSLEDTSGSREYDFMPENGTPEQLRGRSTWLHWKGVLIEELEARLATIDAVDVAGKQEAPSLHAELNASGNPSLGVSVVGQL